MCHACGAPFFVVLFLPLAARPLVACLGQEASLRAERFGLRRDVGTYLGASELWAAGWGKTTADEVGIRAIGRLVVCGFCDKALKGRHIQAQGVNPGDSCQPGKGIGNPEAGRRGGHDRRGVAIVIAQSSSPNRHRPSPIAIAIAQSHCGDIIAFFSSPLGARWAPRLPASGFQYILLAHACPQG